MKPRHGINTPVAKLAEFTQRNYCCDFIFLKGYVCNEIAIRKTGVLNSNASSTRFHRKGNSESAAEHQCVISVHFYK